MGEGRSVKGEGGGEAMQRQQEENIYLLKERKEGEGSISEREEQEGLRKGGRSSREDKEENKV